MCLPKGTACAEWETETPRMQWCRGQEQCLEIMSAEGRRESRESPTRLRGAWVLVKGVGSLKTSCQGVTEQICNSKKTSGPASSAEWARGEAGRC